MDNECKTIACTSMEKTNSRQFIIVIKVILTISVVHFPNELNQNAHSIPTGLAITNLSKFSLSLNLFPAFQTISKSLVPLNQLLSLACANPNF